MNVKYRRAAWLCVSLLLGASPLQAQYIRGVPYFKQQLNSINPSGSCQNTCATMLLGYYGAEGITPDDISRRWGTSRAQTVNGWQDVFNTEAEERGLAVRDVGVSDGRLSEVYRLLDKGVPVSVHGGFTRSGHLIVLLGYDDEYLYAHDPAGDWSRGYGGSDRQAGRHVRYRRDAVEDVVEDLLTGYVRFHALEFVTEGVSASWEKVLPDSVVLGKRVELELAVRPEGGEAYRVTADLSELGGERQVPFVEGEEGVYSLTADLAMETAAPGWGEVVVTVEEEAGAQGAIQLVREIAVLPRADRPIFADGWDAAWTPGSLFRTEIDPASGVQVYEGAASMELQTDSFIMELQPTEPVPPTGYGSLRFAFHPGDLELGARSVFSISVNDDIRTLVKLMGEERTVDSIDPEQRGWQEVEVPMAHFTWPERPIETIRFFGNLRGTFYLDDVRLVVARPCPLRAVWEGEPREAAVAGTPYLLEGTVHLERWDEEGEAPQVTADLSGLGGGSEVALREVGERIYRLEELLTVGAENGLKELTVRVLQPAGEVVHATALSGEIRVLPAADLRIFADGFEAGWEPEPSFSVTLDAEAREQVHEGERALAVRADFFTVDYSVAEPIDPVGYRALRFAFHSGDATVSGRTGAFTLFVNGDARTAVRLLGDEEGEDAISIDLEGWQEVEVPLEAFGAFDGPIRSLRMLGNLQGTFFLDDIRLVADQPAPPVTAVLGERGLPDEFELRPNYPNPFNSGTAMRFVLDVSGEVELAVYDLLGQKVASLIAGFRAAGEHGAFWDGRDAQGRGLASGTYLYRLRVGERVETRKMLLIQ